MAERTDDFADRKCLTPKFQLRYVSLVTPTAMNKNDDAKKRYSIQGRIAKNVNLEKGVKLPDGSRSNSMLEAIEAAILEQWPKKRPKFKEDHKPIKDGDNKGTEDYEDQWYFAANNKNRPQLLNMDKTKVEIDEIEDVFYDGCYCQAYVMACAYDNEGSQGVKWHLIALQKVAKGKPIEYQIDASNMFEAVADDEEDEPEEDEAPKKKSKSRDDDDEDYQPKKKSKAARDDEEDDRPKSKKKAVADDEEDDDDYRPKTKLRKASGVENRFQ